jgi:thiamine pyrophosphate-dependent acetolactate synthase large subunit-like protein
MDFGMSGFETTRRLDRREAVAALLRDRRDLLAVSGLGSPSYDVFAAGDHDANFYLWGAMGGAAVVGLGLALAQPDRPVAVVTGDGEQLMGTGALVTIAVAAPRNLTIVVLDNGEYGETGGQASHTGCGVDLGKVAASMGFPSVHRITTMDEIEPARVVLHDRSSGPHFLDVRIAPGSKPRALPPRDGAFLKARFRAQLGYPVT